MTEIPEQDDKSRSQIKREFRELKDLGVQLAGLSKGQLRSIPLSDGTRDALLEAKGMTRSALQRQYRYLSSLLAEENMAAIRAALAGELKPHADEVASLHEAERWRDSMLSGDESHLAAFVERYPACDRAHLRQLVRNAQKETDRGKPPKSARQLFRYIKTAIRTARLEPVSPEYSIRADSK
jgi:ribosome-associated protein